MVPKGEVIWWTILNYLPSSGFKELWNFNSNIAIYPLAYSYLYPNFVKRYNLYDSTVKKSVPSL